MPTTNPNLEIFSDAVLKELLPKLAPIKAFTRDISPLPGEIGKSVHVGYIANQTAGDFDASSNNYGADAGDVNGVSVTFDKRKLSKFGITDEQALNYPKSWWLDKATGAANAVAEACLKDVIGMFTAANYGDAAKDKTTVSLAGFDKTSIAGIRAAAIKKKLDPAKATLMLHPDYYSALLGTLNAHEYGTAAAVQDGVLRNIVGFRQVIECWQLDSPGMVLMPDALCFINRWLKPVHPESYAAAYAETDEESGLTIGIREYEELSTGVVSISAELAYGRAVGVDTAVLRLVA